MSKEKPQFRLHAQYKKRIRGTKQKEIPMEVLSPHVPHILGFVFSIVMLIFLLPLSIISGLLPVFFLVTTLQTGGNIGGDMCGLVLMIPASLFGVHLCWTQIQRLIRYRYAVRHRDALSASNNLLDGEITAIEGYNDSTKGINYYVRVWYQFETPDKEILNGFSEARRMELHGQELPPVGTPITVLYSKESGGHMMI